MRFKNFILEQISADEAKTVISAVKGNLSKNVQDFQVQLIKNALTSPQFVNLTPGGEENSAPGKEMFQQSEVLFNLKRFIGPRNLKNIKESQVLKFQWRNGSIVFLIVFLGYTNDNKKVATISMDPSLANRGFVNVTAKALQSLGYKLFTHPKDLEPVSTNPEFVEKLMGIFRIVASMGFHSSQFPEVGKNLDKLIKEYPEDWKNLQKRLHEIYGDHSVFYRSMTIDSDRELVEVGSKKIIQGSELTVGDKIYFPARYPWVFIQMTELPEDFEHTPEDVATHYTGRKKSGDTRDPANVWQKTGGGSDSIQIILRCSVPTDRLMYSSMAIMNVSPHVRENEVMVKHVADFTNNEYAPDLGIPCVVVSKSNRHKQTDITDPTGKFNKSVADIDNNV